MEFNWKIVSVDDTTHTMTVEYWNADYSNPVQMNIMKPEVGIDINEYVAKFAPILNKPVANYQTVSTDIEGTATSVLISPPNVISVDQEKNTSALDYLPTSNSTLSSNSPSVTVI